MVEAANSAILRSKDSDFFTAEIDVSKGSLGLKLNEDGVTVALVEEGGLIDQWNAQHSAQITPGVEIRAINGSWNPLQMSQELLKAKTLKLDIWKPQPRNSRSKRAEILEVEAADRNALGAEPIMVLQQRINLEGQKRDQAIEQLTSFMTEAIKTVSNRMEELALTQMKSQQQQSYAMQRLHAMNETISDMRESDRAQILQLKRLEEIQSAATQISVKTEQQQLEHKLNKLSEETKTCSTCIGQLNHALRGIAEDVASLRPKMPAAPAPAVPVVTVEESESDAPMPSDQTIVLPQNITDRTDRTDRCSKIKVDVPNLTQWPTRQSSPPLRPVQNLSAKSEKPVISASVFPRNDVGIHTEGICEAPMVSPRLQPIQAVNWTMSTPRLRHTTSPMPSPRFVASPQRSPRAAQSQSGTQLTHLSSCPVSCPVATPVVLKAWQMRPQRQNDLAHVLNTSNVNLKPCGHTLTSPREALQDSSNSQLMTPRLEKSLPATERSRRVTSPTRNDAARCG